MYKNGINLVEGDGLLGRQKMADFLTAPNIFGIRAEATGKTTTIIDPQSETNSETGLKMIFIQIELMKESNLTIQIEEPGFNDFNLEDPKNIVFEAFLVNQVYKFFAALPFVNFYGLQDSFKLEEGVITAYMNEKMNHYFTLDFVIGPHVQNYLFPFKKPDGLLKISCWDIQSLQTGSTAIPRFGLSMNWKASVVRKKIFPIRLINDGNLFDTTCLNSGLDSNYFHSQVIATISKSSSNQSTEIVFNPTVCIRNLDNLASLNRFILLGCDDSILAIHPKLSRIWFELIFY